MPVGIERLTQARGVSPKSETPIQTVAFAVIGAIAGGIGGIGFVTFVGGAVMLARFRGAGVPPVGAVGHTSKAELLAVGAEQLLAPFVFSLFVALLLTFLYFRFPTARLRLLLLLFGAGGALIAYVWRSRPSIPGDKDQDLALLGTMLVLTVGVLAARMIGERGQRSGHRRERHERLGDRPNAADEPRVDVSTRVSAPLLALTIFVTGTIVGGFATYALNITEPHVRAAALALRDGAPPLTGIYVGESSSTVYIGEVMESQGHPGRGNKRQGRIAEVPRDSVAEVRVGDFEPLQRALRHAQALASQLGSAPRRSAPHP